MSKPELRFTPRVWAKLNVLMDMSDDEVGGFGITTEENPDLVSDFMLVKQTVSVGSVDFDDDGVADYYEAQILAGKEPVHFGRIWIHTHPKGIAKPSGKDKDTFEEVFGKCSWAIMVVIPSGGTPYGEVSFDAPFGGRITAELDLKVDWWSDFEASDVEGWIEEYNKLVSQRVSTVTVVSSGKGTSNGEPIVTARGKEVSQGEYREGRIVSCPHAKDAERCFKCLGWGNCDVTELEAVPVDSSKGNTTESALGTTEPVADDTGFYCPMCYHWSMEEFENCPNCKTPVIAKPAWTVSSEELYAGLAEAKKGAETRD